jgi:HAD superfamily hydrolase (TIGR01509 family)
VVTGDDVAEPKPAPDAYLLAATRLQVSPGQCLALEDSATGLESARRAGMRTLRVTFSATT